VDRFGNLITSFEGSRPHRTWELEMNGTTALPWLRPDYSDVTPADWCLSGQQRQIELACAMARHPSRLGSTGNALRLRRTDDAGKFWVWVWCWYAHLSACSVGRCGEAVAPLHSQLHISGDYCDSAAYAELHRPRPSTA